MTNRSENLACAFARSERIQHFMNAREGVRNASHSNRKRFRHEESLPKGKIAKEEPFAFCSPKLARGSPPRKGQIRNACASGG
jgi:hypothetical protein